MLELDRRGTGVTAMSLSCSRWIKVVRRRETRRRGRQLTRASKGRHGAFAHRVNPTEVWNKVARRREGSRTWRLAGGERSTRFESASQYSQLPLQAEQSRKTEGSQEAMCGPQGKHNAWTPERSNPDRELVKRKQSSDCGRRIRKRDR